MRRIYDALAVMIILGLLAVSFTDVDLFGVSAEKTVKARPTMTYEMRPNWEMFDRMVVIPLRSTEKGGQK